jgi:hypothetical protein
MKKMHNKTPKCATCGYPLSNNKGVKYVQRVRVGGKRYMESIPCSDPKCLYKQEK